MTVSNTNHGHGPSESFPVEMEKARELVNSRIESLSDELREKVNKAIHGSPELCFKEYKAHNALASYLEQAGFDVKRGTYGLETSFEATLGERGRQVVICAEYDALPEIGHGCGHNLIATSSMAAFLGAAHAMRALNIPGRLRILGTPAEEGGGGKAVLIDNGAFDPPEDVAAAIMAHPLSQHSIPGAASGNKGLAGLLLLASFKFEVKFRGQAAHAAGEPWSGRNALDAAVTAYNAIAVLRQQMRPDERVHAIICDGGVATNVIPDYTRMSWGVRAPTMTGAEKLFERVKRCIEAAALATGCSHEIVMTPTYASLRANDSFCREYSDSMAQIGEKVQVHERKPYTASTDMGNVSHLVPSFHGAFGVPAESNVAIHSADFATAAATDEAHAAALSSAKGMAMLALRVLVDGEFTDAARRDFEKPDEPL
ncbi:metal-dependent amidase/aminoacylase/carboxypeptidase [Purpureocillium lavendulum]|uniref:Peptidase M20 domain-containing protein 2 n=1 Tax=Purpureocillium lavendulum TaxID=1247861 RepID=A0AB34G7K1_9HYPO|nr:metal-dependent amidase/aminoacylase/carboxypeptidase [Purpureocillium lavendulum]